MTARNGRSGAERTVLLFISEELREAQKRGLDQQLAKRIQDPEAWRNQLAKPKSGVPPVGVREKLIYAGQFAS